MFEVSKFIKTLYGDEKKLTFSETYNNINIRKLSQMNDCEMQSHLLLARNRFEIVHALGRHLPSPSDNVVL